MDYLMSKREQNVTNKDFADAVFHTRLEGSFIYGATFKEPPDVAPKWSGGPIRDRSLTGKSNYTGGDCNTFYVVSSFYPDAEGRVFRRKEQFAAAHVLTMDDLGGGPSAKIPWDKVVLEPSFAIETSPDNCQVGHILTTPETDADYFNRTVDALIHQGLASPVDPGMVGVTRYVRFPVGINNKTKYDPPHRHVLKEWHPERRYTLKDIIDAYDLKLAPPTPQRAFTSVSINLDEDTYVKVLSDLGLILTGEVKTVDGREMLDIRCPFHEEHSDRADEGSGYFIGGGYKCFHGHCATRTFHKVKEKLRLDHYVDTEELDHQTRCLRVGKPLLEKIDA
jgi:hypothetical protein